MVNSTATTHPALTEPWARLLSQPFIPVVSIASIQEAKPLAEALLAGGINIIEITLRTPCAWDAIQTIARDYPAMKVGVGTLRVPTDVSKIADLGASFAVSPGFSPVLSEMCAKQGVPLLPGVATASEIMLAHAHGHSMLKFFPAEASGGVHLLKAWSSPFTDIFFCPTGGINLAKAAEYLGLSNVVVIGGSWMATSEWMKKGQWERITQATAQALLQLSPLQG
jgi:2-dehydro-3-deoxyphosphogluconate aldolase/(4S)-4-hydroxy-2-oxoglutarate aldolase